MYLRQFLYKTRTTGRRVEDQAEVKAPGSVPETFDGVRHRFSVDPPGPSCVRSESLADLDQYSETGSAALRCLRADSVWVN